MDVEGENVIVNNTFPISLVYAAFYMKWKS